MTDIDIIEDVKILDDENDMYGAKEKALSIVEFIELENNKDLLSKNNLIAIYGKWGTGKSSILKTVEQHLNAKKFDTLWFDTWKNEKDNNLPYSLFKFINCNNKCRTFCKKITNYFTTLILPFLNLI